MYNVSKCKQTIGNDIIALTNILYETPSQPDVSFDNVSAVMRGKYLDAVVNVRNNGLVGAEKTNLVIYADDKIVKEVELDPLGVGFGKKILLTNIWISQISVDEFKFIINSDFEELDKNNNVVVLESKK